MKNLMGGILIIRDPRSKTGAGPHPAGKIKKTRTEQKFGNPGPDQDRQKWRVKSNRTRTRIKLKPRTGSAKN